MIDKFRKSSFFTSILQLALGSVIAQFIVVIISPLITRTYSVEEMGQYALVLTITSIFGSVINWKYDVAIVTCDESDVSELISTSFLSSIISVFIIGITLIIYTFYFTQKYTLSMILLIIILLVFIGITNILVGYNNRMKEYKLISQINVVRTSSQNILLLIFGFLKLGVLGMVASQIFGILFGTKKQVQSLRRDKLNFEFTWNSIFRIFKKYKKFPIYSLPANITNNLSYSILNFFISMLYGLEALGFYSITFRILGLPLSLISANVSKVFFRDALEEKNNTGKFQKTFLKSTMFLISMAVPMVIVLMFFGPNLFEAFFGSEWHIAGGYARILAPMFGVRLVVSALTQGFIIAGRQNLELFFQILFLASSVLTYSFSLSLSLNIDLFLILYSIINTCAYLTLYICLFLLSKGEKND